MTSTLAVKLEPVGKLQPYPGNARTHSPEQVDEIAASIRTFGYTNPVLVDGPLLVAGHGRLLALQAMYAAGEVVMLPGGQALPQGTVPVIDCAGWSERERRAYILADNKIATNAGWDEDLLKFELTYLDGADFDVQLAGFSGEDVLNLFGTDADGTAFGAGSDNHYTQAVDSPEYIPKGEQPAVSDLYDCEKASALESAIVHAELPAEISTFLRLAAQRHTVFDYHAIAEYYCHAPPEVQRLMEDSALVIIDFDKAIAGGFVRMSKRLDEVYSNTFGEGEEGEDDAS